MPPSALKVPPTMTADEFLAWPGDGEGGKYELVDGVLRLMSPASTTHGTIQSALAQSIGQHLDASGSPCRVVTEPAIATRVRAKLNMRVADLGVTCAPDAPGDVALPNPLLLIEVLSPGNAADTWDNVWAYAAIPSVMEIAVLHSTRIEAQVLRRQPDGAWPADPELVGPDDALRLASINLTIALRSVYAKTYLA